MNEIHEVYFFQKANYKNLDSYDKQYFFSNAFSFIFKFYFYFILQYCIGFAIHLHESTMGVHEFPNMNPPPTSYPISSLWIIPCTSPKHPISCIEHRLAICFLHDSIHVSMPFSQIIPPFQIIF